MESLPEETQKEMKEAIKNGKLDEFFKENIKNQDLSSIDKPKYEIEDLPEPLRSKAKAALESSKILKSIEEGKISEVL